MTHFHNPGICESERSDEPHGKDACFLLLLNVWGYIIQASFLLPPCAFQWAPFNWPGEQFWLCPVSFNLTNEIISLPHRNDLLLGNSEQWVWWYKPYSLIAYLQVVDQMDSKLSLEKKIKINKRMLIVQAFEHQPQKPQKTVINPDVDLQ